MENWDDDWEIREYLAEEQAKIPPIDESRVREIVRGMLGDRFLDLKILDLRPASRVSVFIKATEDFYWFEVFDEDPLYDYLDSLDYTFISIYAARWFTGGIYEPGT
ncbi:MAG: hypothetical protein FWG65_02645 [Turicibacter sp.]|nr:hypothetical protein [Turicibacter sp.]